MDTLPNADVVDDLNRLMAEETEACLRYFQMRFRLRGPREREAGQFFDGAIKETLEHAEALAKQIAALGHVPKLTIKLSLGGDRVRPVEALSEALDIEQQALDAYRDFLPRVAGHGTLEAFIRKQIETESDHVDAIRAIVRSASPLNLVSKPSSK